MRKILLALLWLPVAAFADSRTINITAMANPWQFIPSSFTVNAGDIVTLNITVAGGDASPSGHGFIMSPFVDTIPLPKGQTKTVTFTAGTPGTFFYACTVPSCGSGHENMIGTMVVNGSVAPSIGSVSPDTGPTSGGTPVTIAGSNFAAPATVSIGPFQAMNVTVIDSTIIRMITPPGPFSQQAGLPLDVTVTTPGGAATKAGAFHYFVPPLAISSVAPAVGAAGTTVTISGAGFTTALPLTVTFDGIATTATVVNAITIQATAPAHALGAVDVSVRLGATTVTRAKGFTYGIGRRRTVHH